MTTLLRRLVCGAAGGDDAFAACRFRRLSPVRLCGHRGPLSLRLCSIRSCLSAHSRRRGLAIEQPACLTNLANPPSVRHDA